MEERPFFPAFAEKVRQSRTTRKRKGPKNLSALRPCESAFLEDQLQAKLNQALEGCITEPAAEARFL